MFDGPKAGLIRRGLNALLKERYGELQSLELDTKGRSMRLLLLLHGEDEAIEVEVGAYELDESDGSAVLICREIRVSRTWLHHLAQEYGEGVPIPLPPEAARWVRMVLT